MSEHKDRWDKAEIIAKLLGVSIVPLIIAGTAYLLNGQISERSRAAEMTGIAAGILNTPPSNTEYNGDERALRAWAVSVLADPSGNNELTPSLRDILINDKFSFGWPFNSGDFQSADWSSFPEIQSSLEKLSKILDESKTEQIDQKPTAPEVPLAD